MNSRERFYEAMHFGNPDRCPYSDYFAYDSTRQRWEGEGLPKGVDLWEYFGFDRIALAPNPGRIPVNTRFLPPFESKIIEDTEEYTISITGDGAKVKRRKDTPPPAMSQFLEFPLKGREDWNKLKKRLDPNHPDRLPRNLEQLKEEWKNRDYPLGIWCGSLFGVIRDWMGFFNASLAFYDAPLLIHDIMEQLTELYLSLLARALDGVQIDWLMLWEDMAYKGASIISPKHVREFMLPRYRRVTDFVQSKGCDIIMIDSDGDVTELVPLWLEAGINTIHPAEVAAGMFARLTDAKGLRDVVALRKKYRELRIKGGIDKREIAKDKKAIEREVMSKVPFLLERGGFIPEIDHGIPPDISFENFCYYRNLIKKIAEG